MTDKLCTGPCGRLLPPAAFNPHPEGRDGRNARCKDCEYAARQERDRASRAAVLGHYGWACACCGATDDLTIDHIAGGGAEHRRSLSLNAGARFYRWLIAQGFPDGYQTLCRRCNRSKGDGPACRLWHGDPGFKRCTGACGQVKRLAEFRLYTPQRPAGRQSRCRDCEGDRHGSRRRAGNEPPPTLVTIDGGARSPATD